MIARLVLILFLAPSLPAAAGRAEDLLATVKALYAAGQWEEVVRQTDGLTRSSADLDYYRGMSLARLNRWTYARGALEAGWTKAPRDKRFPLELAGIAFRQKRMARAEVLVRAALKLDPRDNYANNFMASLFYLDGNLEGALKYWNRIAQPYVDEIRIDPPLRVDPELLDSSFAFAPRSILRLADYRTTRKRLDQLEIFSNYHFHLQPRQQKTSDTFDMQFAAAEKSVTSKLDTFLGLVRGLPYETLHPEFYNLRHSAINFTSMLRWDSRKRRVSASISAPLGGRAAWRYRLYADARDEDWDISRTFQGNLAHPSDLKLRTVEVGGGVSGVLNSRVNWSGRVALSNRNFPTVAQASPTTPSEFVSSLALEARSTATIGLLRIPDRRFTLVSRTSGTLGRAYAQALGTYGGVEGSVGAHWFPYRRGDDLEMVGKFQGGRLFGSVPFDKLYVVGLERDNELIMRAHIGTEHGRKGNSPLGRSYLLSNWEINKNIMDAGWLRLRLAPFLDIGRTYDDRGEFGSRRWMWDTGGEVKVGLVGQLVVILTYGKDLRTGRNTFYTTVESVH